MSPASGLGFQLRPVIPAVRVLLVAFVVLTATAAVVLYLLSSRTEQFFAWTVQPALTAAFMGAGYATGCTISLLALRERAWVQIRLPYVVVGIFATLTLGATVLHADRFHFAAPGTVARVAAIVWLAVYVLVPPAMAVLAVMQGRTAGDDPLGGPALPSWLRAVLGVQGAVMLGSGVALYVAPAAASTVWPWDLTPLTARSIAAWLVALGAAALLAARDNDLPVLRAPMVSYAVLGAAQLGALARFPDQLRGGGPGRWVYTVMVVSVLLTGLYGAYATRRVRPAGRW